MAKVVDAARVTTPSNTVWRTCISCNQPKPLADDVERCPICQAVHDSGAPTGWEHLHRYAGVLGRIEAWALRIPNVSDAERLDHIREALATLPVYGKAVK